MERKEFNDSAQEAELKKQLEKVIVYGNVKELINKYNAIENKTKEITENFLVTQYFNRKTKALQSYSVVASLREMVFYNMDGTPAGKIVPGQVGEIAGGPPEPYEVGFIDRPDLNFSDHDSGVSLGFMRNELLLLVEDYDDLDNEKRSIPKCDFNNEKNLQSQFPSTSEIEKFVAETAKSISKILPAYYETNLKPGNLVTITVDFFEEKNENYEIKIFAGEVGVIVDPTKGVITNENNESQINTSKELQEDEVLVYFPTLSVWHMFDAFITGYKNLEPFDGDQCYILSKSYLLPLFFKNQTDTNQVGIKT